MIILASLIPAIILSVVLVKTHTKKQSLEPIKVKAQNNKRPY